MLFAIMFGGPGSGKSTFVKNQLYKTHLPINVDILWNHHSENLILEGMLNARVNIVIDGVNATLPQRVRYFKKLEGRKYKVIAYVMTTPLEDALVMNKQRSRRQHLPDNIVITNFKRLIPPTLGEGFDEIYHVTINGAGYDIVRTA